MEAKEINWEAYEEGFEAWNLFHASSFTDREMNPYVLDEVKWKSWNKGWNANLKGIEPKPS